MTQSRTLLLALLWLCTFGFSASAQTLTFATVERPPFSMSADGHSGFSIDLMRQISQQLGREVRFETADSFGAMLDRVQTGEVDGAIANISITAAREEVMDFSQPIFESGLQIMVRQQPGISIWQQILTWEVATYIVLAAAILFAGGMLMWAFERRVQPYFQHPAREAMFPSFWWALNLVVNGGFEERMPRSMMGRFLGVVMVISSLFFVSIFVARITAAMTVTALSGSITGLNDLENKRVGTVAGSTAALFMDARELRFTDYPDFAKLAVAFSDGDLDAVMYDGPLLSYFLKTHPDVDGQVLDRVFRAESYGIALPSNSPLRETLDQAILTLRENGAYGALVADYFD